MLVVCQKAEQDAVHRVVDQARSVHLYGNKRTPTRHDGVSDFIEVEGGGYEPLALDPAEWAVQDDNGGSKAVYPVYTWRFSGAAGYVYGYYVADGTGKLLWAEMLDPGPFLAANPGDFFTLKLAFGLRRATGK